MKDKTTFHVFFPEYETPFSDVILISIRRIFHLHLKE